MPPQSTPTQEPSQLRPSRRTIVSGVTLTVLLLVLAGMAVVGFRAATAPVPSLSGVGTNSEDCSEEELQVQRFIRRDDVQVSVYNAGSSSGQAGRALDLFEDAGFIAGNAGNAPEGVGITRARVRTTQPDDSAALLVARSISPRVEIDVVEEDLGPGVDVIVGDNFPGLSPDGPRRVRLAEPVEQCVDIS